MAENAQNKSVGEERVIAIRGARTHNLANVSLDIPRDRLVVVTGLSGSGKSSLAFDTIYAEGQRRYVESLSAYARQFLGQMVKPDVDQITGLPPTIAISQQGGRSNPRSTVATTTEIYDFLRLLFARVGTPHCPKCGKVIARQSVSQIVDALLDMPEGTKAVVLAPLVRKSKGDHAEVLARVLRDGFVRVRIDGETHEIKAVPELGKTKAHTIEAVVDRVVIKRDMRLRLTESVEASLRVGDGVMTVSACRPGGAEKWEETTYSERYSCIDCGVSLPEMAPRLFSFNSPHGACRECDGLGTVLEFDAELVVSDASRSLNDGAIEPWRRSGQRMSGVYNRLLDEFCERFKVSPSTPYKLLPEKKRTILLHGTTKEDEKAFKCHFEGALPNLVRRWKETESESVKDALHAYMTQSPCKACAGSRLRAEAMAVKVGGLSIDAVTAMSIDAAAGFFLGLAFSGDAQAIAATIVDEIRRRLKFMIDVGIGYLTLNRTTATLSGGEAQRIRLATQVGSGLVGVCYVLDEPTTGLHPRDTAKLIRTLRELTALGNSVLVVEHDVEAIAAADWIVDVGPGAGLHGGRVLVNGPREALMASGESMTAKYLRGDVAIEAPVQRRDVSPKKCVEIRGASENNLKGIDVRIPLGVFCCITGVSGSGKSSLVNQILLPALKNRLADGHARVGKHDRVLGVSQIEKIIEIDQSPIGRTPRSNAATYTGIFDHIRDLFAKTREAKLRGYNAARFSFNVKGGRCEACQGQGLKRIEMHFLPDIFVQCDQCRGTRYSREMLEIRYRGKSIADVLELRVEEAMEFFESFSAIRQLLAAMQDVGLGYLALGQSSTTLSGGEAQRVKLAAELGKSAMGHTLYVLDEPTTGLHFADIHRLVDVLNRLCNLGHSVVVIEHNLDVVRQADWIIDLGPEGGEAGGRIVAEGTPETVKACAGSYTGKWLAGA
ncbi:MAG: excinuclease ABC subunit UvrA [Planctomycetes bacterium]|nr:excinuclease ABC subunit UvrA [Planctomycetota bacterium]